MNVRHTIFIGKTLEKTVYLVRKNLTAWKSIYDIRFLYVKRSVCNNNMSKSDLLIYLYTKDNEKYLCSQIKVEKFL